MAFFLLCSPEHANCFACGQGSKDFSMFCLKTRKVHGYVVADSCTHFLPASIIYLVYNLEMTTPENLFILITLIVLAITAFVVRKIQWGKIGLKPESLCKGWVPIILFSLGVFILVQASMNFFHLPIWVTDKDPLLPLLVIVFLQELIFRGFLITWLEKWGKQKALWISTIVFGLIHLAQPGAWLMTALSFMGGYFWGWHFLKFRNIYLLTISHLIVNLSFNYALFDLVF